MALVIAISLYLFQLQNLQHRSLHFSFSFSSVVITVVGMLMLLDGGISSTNS